MNPNMKYLEKNTQTTPRLDNVLQRPNLNPYGKLIFDVFGTLFIIKVFL